MAKNHLSYESISNHYVFYSSPGNPDEADLTDKNIAKREDELREGGWVSIPGTFELDAPQREIVKAEQDTETSKHLAHLMAFYAGNHEKANETPYTVYAYLSVWVNSEDEGGIGELGVDVTFTSDPEGKRKIGVAMFTYLGFEWDDTYAGFTAEEWVKLDGKTFPIGTPIWTDWGKEITILIDPKQGK